MGSQNRSSEGCVISRRRYKKNITAPPSKRPVRNQEQNIYNGQYSANRREKRTGLEQGESDGECAAHVHSPAAAGVEHCRQLLNEGPVEGRLNEGITFGTIHRGTFGGKMANSGAEGARRGGGRQYAGSNALPKKPLRSAAQAQQAGVIRHGRNVGRR